MGEIAPGVPPQGAKTYFVFLLSMQHGLSATYHAPISTIFETTDVNRFPHAYTSEKFSTFCAGGFPGHKNSPKYGTLGSVIELQLKRHKCGPWESFRGLVDIPRMCLLYVNFGGGRMVWAL